MMDHIIIAILFAQSAGIAFLLYKWHVSKKSIKTNRIEMGGFEITVKDNELTIKPTK